MCCKEGPLAGVKTAEVCQIYLPLTSLTAETQNKSEHKIQNEKSVRAAHHTTHNWTRKRGKSTATLLVLVCVPENEDGLTAVLTGLGERLRALVRS